MLLPLPVQTKNTCSTLDQSSDSLTNNYIIWNYCRKGIAKINMGGTAPQKIEQQFTFNACSELKYLNTSHTMKRCRETGLKPITKFLSGAGAAVHKASRIVEVSYMYLEYLPV